MAEDLERVVDDALKMNRVSSIGCFASNLAASELLEYGEAAFDLLDERFRKEDIEKLFNYRGFGEVLGYFFVLGNRYAPEKLSLVLKEYPPKIVATLLGHGPLALQTEPVSTRLQSDILLLQQHQDPDVHKWAVKFGKQVKWKHNEEK